jgi:hypothetical protein
VREDEGKSEGRTMTPASTVVPMILSLATVPSRISTSWSSVHQQSPLKEEESQERRQREGHLFSSNLMSSVIALGRKGRGL